MVTMIWIGTDGNYASSDNWSATGIPIAGDDVYLPPGGSSISTGLNQSAVLLNTLTVQAGYTASIGTTAAYLQAATGRLSFQGTGVSYIDTGTATVSRVDVYDAATPAQGRHGLYLKGSSIAVLNVVSGNVGVAAIPGETSLVTTTRVVGSGAVVRLGSGVTSNDYYQTDGDNTVECVTSTAKIWGGKLLTRGVGAIAALEGYGGEVRPESSGTITALRAYGGEIDMTQSGISRTVTTATVFAGGSLSYDPGVVTVTTLLASSGPLTVSVQQK